MAEMVFLGFVAFAVIVALIAWKASGGETEHQQRRKQRKANREMVDWLKTEPVGEDPKLEAEGSDGLPAATAATATVDGPREISG